MRRVDESFKKPGAIPFKWEIQPGVPKVDSHQQHQPVRDDHDHYHSLPSTPQRLTPPPRSRPFFTPTPDHQTPSFRSTSSLRSDRNPPLLIQPEMVSTGCFLAPWLKRKWGSKRCSAKPKLEREPDYTSEPETSTHWSMSTRKSLCDSQSPTSSSFSSHRSSPRPTGDIEWAGFGLF